MLFRLWQTPHENDDSDEIYYFKLCEDTTTVPHNLSCPNGTQVCGVDSLFGPYQADPKGLGPPVESIISLTGETIGVLMETTGARLRLLCPPVASMNEVIPVPKPRRGNFVDIEFFIDEACQHPPPVAPNCHAFERVVSIEKGNQVLNMTIPTETSLASISVHGLQPGELSSWTVWNSSGGYSFENDDYHTDNWFINVMNLGTIGFSASVKVKTSTNLILRAIAFPYVSFIRESICDSMYVLPFNYEAVGPMMDKSQSVINRQHEYWQCQTGLKYLVNTCNRTSDKSFSLYN